MGQVSQMCCMNLLYRLYSIYLICSSSCKVAASLYFTEKNTEFYRTLPWHDESRQRKVIGGLSNDGMILYRSL